MIELFCYCLYEYETKWWIVWVEVFVSGEAMIVLKKVWKFFKKKSLLIKLVVYLLYIYMEGKIEMIIDNDIWKRMK